MRAVLRATFAARRRAHPTAAENSLLSFLLFRFMMIYSRISARVIIHAPSVGQKTVRLLKIRPAPVKTTEHIGAWNIVTALPYSSRDAAQCQSRRRQT